MLYYLEQEGENDTEYGDQHDADKHLRCLEDTTCDGAVVADTSSRRNQFGHYDADYPSPYTKPQSGDDGRNRTRQDNRTEDLPIRRAV